LGALPLFTQSDNARTVEVLAKYLFDKFLLALLAAIFLASIFPLDGAVEAMFAFATKLGVGLLFFLHGARLSHKAVWAGLLHWRLHVLVLSCTFVLFPLVGLGAGWLIPALGASPFYIGILYLCFLPSTVQSSIAFTSLARGNVAAAIVAASASNVLGVFITPLLVSVLLATSVAGESLISGQVFFNILLQLFFPFMVGQIVQPWWGDFLRARKDLTSIVDRTSIIMVVFLAFSEAAKGQVWQVVSWGDLGLMLAFDSILLGFVLWVSWFVAKICKFNLADRITVMFCGSKKSLASGAPMANAIFSQTPLVSVGLIIVPLMLFHQIQLLACTFIAQHLSQRQIRGTPHD